MSSDVSLPKFESKASHPMIRQIVVQKVSEQQSLERVQALALYEVARTDGRLEPIIKDELLGRLATPSEMDKGTNKIAEQLVKLYE